ncbi:Protein of unknown function [Pyronema omphalodes CBS 100304]|uniref:Uncharacterized protein n=1 Tax=Pyronema omphalodes (strain CBS 100304) TaxID=1076935 RepID=U4L0C2_PYROM|nr:Protein of unknown function [Pyronema omphalodes CBS 100304]
MIYLIPTTVEYKKKPRCSAASTCTVHETSHGLPFYESTTKQARFLNSTLDLCPWIISMPQKV